MEKDKIKNPDDCPNKIQLTPEQIKMLEMSEEDIKNGRLISHEDLVKKNLEWLKYS